MEAHLIDACGNYIILIDMSTVNECVEECYEIFKCNFSPWLSTINWDLLCILTNDGNIKADFWNKDGSREHVCYNAMRSIPMVIYNTINRGKILDIKTQIGVFQARSDNNYNELYIPYSFISIKDRFQNSILIDVGTPHLVTPIIDIKDLVEKGDRGISGNLNINYSYYNRQESHINARTFERGVGETKSCGSGAVSISIASELELSQCFRHNFQTTIKFISGEILKVISSLKTSTVILQGQSRHVDSYMVQAL